jgi:hypothetical protein
MIAVRRPPGAGAARLCAAFITALILAVPAVPAAAQEPVPRDTIPRDTLVVDPELLPEAEASDTAPPPARPVVPFPSMRTAPTAGFAAGVWHWDREALLRETPTSLVDLLERIPGVTTFRAGIFGQPEAASAFGGTAARVEIELDGYVIDPLGTASLDLAHMPLAHIRELHVQRRLGLLRIRVTTEEPADTIPYTRVEAGIGQPAANLFRGLLLAPHVIIGPLGFALEKLDTDGANGRERSDLFSGWGKWGWTDGQRGRPARTGAEYAGAVRRIAVAHRPGPPGCAGPGPQHLLAVHPGGDLRRPVDADGFHPAGAGGHHTRPPRPA